MTLICLHLHIGRKHGFQHSAMSAVYTLKLENYTPFTWDYIYVGLMQTSLFAFMLFHSAGDDI